MEMRKMKVEENLQTFLEHLFLLLIFLLSPPLFLQLSPLSSSLGVVGCPWPLNKWGG